MNWLFHITWHEFQCKDLREKSETKRGSQKFFTYNFFTDNPVTQPCPTTAHFKEDEIEDAEKVARNSESSILIVWSVFYSRAPLITSQKSRYRS